MNNDLGLGAIIGAAIVAIIGGLFGWLTQGRKGKSDVEVAAMLKGCGLVERHPALNTISKGLPVPADEARHSPERKHFAVPFIKPAVGFVAGLLEVIRPAAVLRLIIAVVVNAIEGMACWARPHVAQERRKVLYPFFANGNAAPAISREAAGARVEAPVLHVKPYSVFPRRRVALAATHTGCEAVLPLSGGKDLAAKASATLAIAASQTAPRHPFFGAADASAKAEKHPVAALGSDHRPASENVVSLNWSQPLTHTTSLVSGRNFIKPLGEVNGPA